MDITALFTDGMPATYLAMIIVVSVTCQWLAWLLRVPSILILLVVGFGLGQWVSATDVLDQNLLYAAVSILVGIILFEGSLTLRFSELSGLDQSVRRLCSVAVLVAWPLIALAAWIAGVPGPLAVLIGALLVVTGPTVINPIVRQLRPTRRVSTLLRWEGIVVDPIGAVIATLVFQAVVTAGEPIDRVILGLLLTVLIGFGLGFPVGWSIGRLLARHAIPDHLQGVVFLGIAVGLFVLSNSIQPESGLLTVTVLGITLANQHDINLNKVREFKEHLQVLFVGSLFVLLAGQISTQQLMTIIPVAAIFVPLLIFVIRPASIFLALWRTDSTKQERTLLAFMAPRGIVAAAVTSIFALEMHHHSKLAAKQAEAATDPTRAERLTAHAHHLEDLAKHADNLVPLVFMVVVVTVAVYGLGVGRLAQHLGLASASSQGVLFVGAKPWIRLTAKRLQEAGVQVQIVSTDFRAVSKARTEGIPAEFTHILSDYALHEMDVAGLGTVVAATGDDELNSTAAREFGHTFGTANCYQLARAEKTSLGSEKRKTGRHLSAQIAFNPPVHTGEMAEKIESGLTVRRTRLSREFTREDFYERYGKNTTILFTIVDGKVKVFTKGVQLPTRSAEVIAILPARSKEQSNKPTTA